VVLLRWHADPVVVLGLCALVFAYLSGVRRVRARGGTVEPGRLRWFQGAVTVLVVALCSPVATLSEERFSVHMVQHLLLTFGAAPALAFSAPVTLLLQACGPGRGRRRVLAVLHSLPIRVLSHPVFAWVLFAGVMYATHFSALYDASLSNPVLHGFEHLLYLSAAALFWWPVVRRDPVPGTFPWPGRLLYLFLAMPLQSLLGVAILNGERVLYEHYARSLGATAALADQNLAGAIMWGGGDALMLTALAAAVAGWMRHDARATVRIDAKLDAARARAASARR
jgi:putative copper resistance protein D